MSMLDRRKVAIVFGTIAGGWHAAWALLVAFGAGEPLIDFILWAHMIDMEYAVESFSASATVLLVMATFTTGWIFGWVLAYLWNWFREI